MISRAHESSSEIQGLVFKKGEFNLKQLQERAMRERENLKKIKIFLACLALDEVLDEK